MSGADRFWTQGILSLEPKLVLSWRGEALLVYQEAERGCNVSGGRWTASDFRTHLVQSASFTNEETTAKNDPVVSPRPHRCLMAKLWRELELPFFFYFFSFPCPKVISFDSGGDERFHIFISKRIHDSSAGINNSFLEVLFGCKLFSPALWLNNNVFGSSQVSSNSWN